MRGRAEDREATAQDRTRARVRDCRAWVAAIEGGVVAGRYRAGLGCSGGRWAEVDTWRRVQDQPGSDVAAVVDTVRFGQPLDRDAPTPRQREQRVTALDDV